MGEDEETPEEQTAEDELDHAIGGEGERFVVDGSVRGIEVRQHFQNKVRLFNASDRSAVPAPPVPKSMGFFSGE